MKTVIDVADYDKSLQFEPEKLYVGGIEADKFWEYIYGTYPQDKLDPIDNTHDDDETLTVLPSTEDVKIGFVPLSGCIDIVSDSITTMAGYVESSLVNPVEIKFAKMYDDVKIPTKRDEDAGLDIYAHFVHDNLSIPPHATASVPTGLKSSIDPKYYLELKERGSTGGKGISLRSGIIDSGYRGEWFVFLTNTTNNWFIISKDNVEDPDVINAYAAALFVPPEQITLYPYDKAICQAIVRLNFKTDSKEISLEELEAIPSERGDGKLGSSGK